jgi:hypothetical protein
MSDDSAKLALSYQEPRADASLDLIKVSAPAAKRWLRELFWLTSRDSNLMRFQLTAIVRPTRFFLRSKVLHVEPMPTIWWWVSKAERRRSDFWSLSFGSKPPRLVRRTIVVRLCSVQPFSVVVHHHVTI